MSFILDVKNLCMTVCISLLRAIHLAVVKLFMFEARKNDQIKPSEVLYWVVLTRPGVTVNIHDCFTQALVI